MNTIKNAITIFLLSICLIFNNCTSNRNNKIKGIIKIDLDNVKSISVNDIYKSIKLIPLEKNNESLIAKISKLIPRDDKFYVLDKQSYSILIFDNSGHYLSKICKYGKGVGEYTLIDDFEINPYTNNIEILVSFGFIYEYDLSGNFIKKYNLQTKGRGVHYLKDVSKDIVALYSKSEDKNLILYSKSSNAIIKQLFSVPQKIRFTPIQTNISPFSTYNEKVIFYQGFTNDVYELDEKELKVKYSWDFGSHNIDLSKLPDNKDQTKKMVYPLSHDFVFGFNGNCEDSNFIYTIVLVGRTWYNLRYNKLNGSYILFNHFKQNSALPPYEILFYKEGIITSIDPFNISRILNNQMLDEPNRRILEKIKIEDNPVLVYYTFKKN